MRARLRKGHSEHKTGAERVPIHISFSSGIILHRDHFRNETQTNVGLTVALDVTSEFETEAQKKFGEVELCIIENDGNPISLQERACKETTSYKRKI